MIGALSKFANELKGHMLKGRVTVYAPSSSSATNWQNFFGTNKSIYTMSGHISFSEGMFRPKLPNEFKAINFIIAGSSEPHKGQLSVVYAFINFYNQYYKQDKTNYRDFTLTIAGIKPEAGGYYTDFIINASSSLKEKIKLLYNPDINQMHEAMAGCNFTITYSIKDSFSIVTMEGMAYGHPIVRSESSGRAEQLTPYNGWPVSTKEWEGLVDTIECVLNKEKTSNEELAEMSKKSIEIAKKNHNARYRIIEDIAKAAK
jgi:glycosyltransferase involved in cell wall biosynthesis